MKRRGELFVPEKFKAVVKARETVRIAKQDLITAVRTAFPEGIEVSWDHGGHTQQGWVVRTVNEDRIRVQNRRSGVTSWINLYRILEIYRK